MAMLLDSLDSAIADVPPIRWRTDYAAVMADAENARGMMVVYFDDRSDPCIRFEQEASSNMGIAARLTATCCVRLPMDAEISVGGQPIRLIDHPAFTPLKGGPGLAILDFADPEPANRGRVVKTLNFSSGRTCTADDLGLLPRQPGDSRPGAGLGWLTDYGKAVETAQQDNRMLLVYFYREDGGGGCRQFQSETLADAAIAAGLERYVLLKLPTAAEVSLAGANTVLLKHPSLAEMVGLPGIAIIDYSDPQAPYHGQVVSTFPFLRGRAYTREQMNVILDLPPGKLTQRTLIYAIKTHPERPQSASGKLDAYLAAEAESHSQLQARIRLQGHHAWATRFQRINRRLPWGLLASEVCAESWPGQSLLEAAIDCVHSWRRSSGHWSSVRAFHPIFAYDMRRGNNGIWYATGIFGKRGR
ncbi:MAG: hypothetical protein PHN77_12125 [Thermoguttaceae bacterium]|jgi:hypothetical protein|nr:hypothetical protein [Thermoguttaceae bacterium]